MSQSTVISLILLAIISAWVGYMVGQDDRDRERCQSSQQIVQTSQHQEGDIKQK
jgi:hypothetical protein